MLTHKQNRIWMAYAIHRGVFFCLVHCSATSPRLVDDRRSQLTKINIISMGYRLFRRPPILFFSPPYCGSFFLKHTPSFLPSFLPPAPLPPPLPLPSFSSLHFTLLHISSLHISSFTSVHFTSLHISSLHISSLHFTSHHFTSMHIACRAEHI